MIQTLQSLLEGAFPRLVRTQLPMQVARADQRLNLPEPDLAVLQTYSSEYRTRHPRGSEVRLVIEVSDSSWQMDSVVKKDLYERASVPVYWIVDLEGNRIRVHVLQIDGSYRSSDETEIVSFEAGRYRVEEILNGVA